MKIFKEKTFRLYNADCMDALKSMKENSVDAIVSDPPYGLSIAGHKWDYDVPSVELWENVLRVLKPGGHILVFAGSRTYHRMVCNIEDAGFEIRDTIMWLYGCFDDQTSILTERGWVNGLELLEDDKVAQWDKNTGAIEFVVPDRIIRKHHRGPMVRLLNRHTDQLVTPDHDVIAKIRTHARNPAPVEFEKVKAMVLKNHWAKDIPVAGTYRGAVDVDSEYAYMVGWWLTDAWVHGDKKACMFSQCKPKTLAKLKSALSKADCSFSEYTKEPKKAEHQVEHTFYVTGTLANRLLSEFSDRKVSWDMLHWKKAARLALVKGMTDGDGSYKFTNKKMDGAKTFWSKDSERRQIFLALCVSLGYRANDDGFEAVYFNTKTDTTQLQFKHKLQYPDYDGEVWCVTVPKGAVVVQRNGGVFISGNSGFPKSLNVSKAIDRKLGAAPKVVEGKRALVPNPKSRPTGAAIAKKTGGFKGGDRETITEAGSKEAAEWEGWGTQLKPSYEPIVLARKPFDGDVATNVLKHRTGAMNIAACSVPVLGRKEQSEVGKVSVKGKISKDRHANQAIKFGFNKNADCEIVKYKHGGRFPSNTMHDGSRDVEEAFKPYNEMGKEPFSRFFYCAKPTVKERDRGLKSLDDQPHALSGGARKAVERGETEYTTKEGLHQSEQGGFNKITMRKNIHPTVKPLKLMRWLCKLIVPPGGVVMDPYLGSGTTGAAALLEGFRFIGAEREAKYARIARGRLLHAAETYASQPKNLWKR